MVFAARLVVDSVGHPRSLWNAQRRSDLVRCAGYEANADVDDVGVDLGVVGGLVTAAGDADGASADGSDDDDTADDDEGVALLFDAQLATTAVTPASAAARINLRP